MHKSKLDTISCSQLWPLKEKISKVLVRNWEELIIQKIQKNPSADKKKKVQVMQDDECKSVNDT